MTTPARNPEPKRPARISVACIGECMIELAHVGPNALKMAFGGDTSNTAVYLARLTRSLDIDVDYVTALGDDAYSDAMLAFWQEEGVGTGLVTRLSGRLPGLYTIRTDEHGERSFTYWRSQAAARELFLDGRDAALKAALRAVDLVYLSGITLSILDGKQRAMLFTVLDGVRRSGGKVAFDGNFRPTGWPDLDAARIWFGKILERTDIALPTLDDEQALFGSGDEHVVAKRLHDHGVGEVAVKLGAEGCFLSTGDETDVIETSAIDPVVDSTAAGDSFNAGYLAGRLVGASPGDAARVGHRLASRVICHHGAVIPADAMPENIMADAGCSDRSPG